MRERERETERERYRERDREREGAREREGETETHRWKKISTVAIQRCDTWPHPYNKEQEENTDRCGWNCTISLLCLSTRKMSVTHLSFHKPSFAKKRNV